MYRYRIQRFTYSRHNQIISQFFSYYFVNAFIIDFYEYQKVLVVIVLQQLCIVVASVFYEVEVVSGAVVAVIAVVVVIIFNIMIYLHLYKCQQKIYQEIQCLNGNYSLRNVSIQLVFYNENTAILVHPTAFIYKTILYPKRELNIIFV